MIVSIKADQIIEHISTNSISDMFFVFDNYTGKNENLNLLAVLDYPIKLDIMTCVIAYRGYLRIRIEHREFTVDNNSFILIMNDKVFQVLEVSPDFKADVVCLQNNFFVNDYDHNNSMKMLSLISDNPYQKIPDQKIDSYTLLMNQIKGTMAETDNIYRKQIVLNYINIIYYDLSNLLISHKPDLRKATRQEDIAKRFLNDVSLNFRHERGMSFYADKLFLTPKYFSTVIYKATGKHATEWIDFYVVMEAKALLKSTNMPIQQIGYSMNFTSPSHFVNYFRRLTGMTPRQYRNS